MDLQQGELGGHVTVGGHLIVRVVEAPWGGTGDARHGTGYDTSCCHWSVVINKLMRLFQYLFQSVFKNDDSEIIGLISIT